MSFKLQPCDVCIDVNEKMTPWAILERWALGNPHTHVRVFFGKGGPLTPVFYESVGRGVIFTNASDALGQKMVVMRLHEVYEPHVDDIKKQMFEIATDPQSQYDYACIPGLVVPRLICEKLGIPLPLRYQRNPIYVCSEAAAEPFWRVEIEVLPRDVIPLPHDFLFSPVLHKAEEGTLSESWLAG